MRQNLLIFIFIISGFILKAQTTIGAEEGNISYITSQNIYVKFKSTKKISVGDTLFVKRNKMLIPALKVTNLSSISCVCMPISELNLNVNDKVETKQKEIEIEDDVDEVKVIKAAPITTIINKPDSITNEKKVNKQKINARLSLSSYSNFSNTEGGNSQRMRYTFSMKAKNIADSKISVETYISFVHRDNNWDEIKENIFDGLKIYSLAVKYQPVESMSIWLGRKINRNISNIGAIDGLQIEKSFKSIVTGAFVGSRPDYMDYSYNFNLLQYGAYVGHVYKSKLKREMRTTLALVEQTNSGKTDRRFAYFQYSNSLIKNLNFFATAELELYQNINGVQQSTFNLTNLYIILRYRVMRQLSFSFSFSDRKNLIYYETYKDYVERLIKESSLQGFRFKVNFRPIKYLSIGAKIGYRSRKDDPRPTKNLRTYISYSRIPGLNASMTLSAILLETAYLSGRIYSLRISRDLIPGKLFGSLSYRYVDYKYSYVDSGLNQHVGDVNLTWKIIRKISLSVAYEGIFETTNNYNRLYINLTTRL